MGEVLVCLLGVVVAAVSTVATAAEESLRVLVPKLVSGGTRSRTLALLVA